MTASPSLSTPNTILPLQVSEADKLKAEEASRFY
ncbi:hypothetical protein BDEG_24056 [Batrachochytrium dendrobatidis JEL423]|uniref:Uncharacterized protein n=1 Tax=Batrachochytrium dendrobatidis (strain JEL423) TaxID=403673 RepID=A0A177WJK5_BATDL|nr:hypothetical protein BDEG_24056 [Batrachochytrium dendrobatidis JEL423]